MPRHTKAWKFKLLLSQNEELFGPENLCKIKVFRCCDTSWMKKLRRINSFYGWILVTSFETFKLTYFIQFWALFSKLVQIMLQYNDVSGAIQNNGWVSESFTLSIGVSQGRLMSPYFFIISAEILANFIRRDEDIKGFKTSWSRAHTKPIRWRHDVNTRRLRGLNS